MKTLENILDLQKTSFLPIEAAFYTQTQSCLLNIVISHNSLKDICDIFGGYGDIRPTQCNDVIISLSNLQDVMQQFCKLIDKNIEQPLVTIPISYELAVSVHYTEQQICKMIGLVEEFRIVCLDSSRRTKKQRGEIYGKAEYLLESIDDFLKKTDTPSLSDDFKSDKNHSHLDDLDAKFSPHKEPISFQLYYSKKGKPEKYPKLP